MVRILSRHCASRMGWALQSMDVMFGSILTFMARLALVLLREVGPEKWGSPLAGTSDEPKIMNAEHDGQVWRRIPQPLRLLSEETGSAS